MLGSSLAKAALSAAVVGVLLALLRQANPRVAGLAAAVPINSIPALFWLSLDYGAAYASAAALGSLWGTGLTAVLGLAFARLAALCHAALAAVLAWLAIGALAIWIWRLPAALAAVTGLALLVVLAGEIGGSQAANAARQCPARVRDTWLSMAVAGAMSLLTSELSRHGGAQLCGLVATIPVIGASTAFAGHRRGGPSMMLRVVDGYLAGMLAKATFLTALYFAWQAGAGAAAWPLALSGGGVALAAQRSIRAVRQRGGERRRPAGSGVGKSAA